MTRMKAGIAEVIDESVRAHEVVDRKTISLFISSSQYEAFKRACREQSPSRVLEQFMRTYAAEKGSLKKERA